MVSQRGQTGRRNAATLGTIWIAAELARRDSRLEVGGNCGCSPGEDTFLR